MPRTGKAPQEGRIRARNQSAIMDAALRIFVEKGYEGASIAEIAARSGLPKANVYYYFKSKEAIYRAIIGDLIKEWDQALALLAPECEPAAALADYIRAKLAFSRRHAAQSKMFATEALQGGRFLTRRDRAHMRAVTLDKAKVFAGWIAAGRMAPVDPMHLFILLWSTTQFYADFDVVAGTALGRRPRAADYARAEETITRIVLKGCGIVP